MSKDVIVIVCYVVIVAFLCIIWNKFMMRQYNLRNNQSSLVYNAILRCGSNIDQIKDFAIAGNGPDQNNDYEFIEAVKKISISNDIRVRLND